MGHINTVLGLFLMLMIGYGAKKLNILKEENAGIINSIIINITLPAYVIAHILGKELDVNMFATPVVLYVITGLTVILSLLICKILKLSDKLTYSIVLTASFANTGFLGYPIVEALFKGNDMAIPTAVIVDQIGMQLMLYISAPIIAAFIIKENKEEKITFRTLLGVFRSPVLSVSVLALIFHRIILPDCIMQTCNHLSGATVPLVMIAIGLKIKPSETPKYVLPVIIVLILKMIFQPILMHLGLSAFINDKYIIDIATIQMGLSPAMITSILIDRYKGDTHFACAAIFVCTLLTIISVPFTANILGI
ncbi:MAG: AEC family transporter [Armatimonadetes bacterium]|nr:AEC family transporter [Candidatus Hippobium faecium]